MSPSLSELAKERGLSVEEARGMVVVFKGHGVEDWCKRGPEQWDWGGYVELVNQDIEGSLGFHSLRRGVFFDEGVCSRVIWNDEDLYKEMVTSEEARARIIAENKRLYGAERFF